MFDLSAISSVAETLETGVRDIDSRLEQIVNLMREQNALLTAIARESGIDVDALFPEPGDSTKENA